MTNEVSNDEARVLDQELVAEVNPTVVIGVFIAVSTFFILTSTMSTVVESFSWPGVRPILRRSSRWGLAVIVFSYPGQLLGFDCSERTTDWLRPLQRFRPLIGRGSEHLLLALQSWKYFLRISGRPLLLWSIQIFFWDETNNRWIQSWWISISRVGSWRTWSILFKRGASIKQD